MHASSEIQPNDRTVVCRGPVQLEGWPPEHQFATLACGEMSPSDGEGIVQCRSTWGARRVARHERREIVAEGKAGVEMGCKVSEPGLGQSFH